MKKFLGIIVAALILIPINAKAIVTLSGSSSKADANGLITGSIYLNVEEGSSITEAQTITINAKHAIIKSVEGFGSWTVDSEKTMLTDDGLSAILVLKYSENNGVYEGKGEKIQVGVVKYEHDSSYVGSEKCEVQLGFNDAYVNIEETTTPNAKTGSVLPYVGIIAGISLIAAAFVISKKTNKLYKI